MDFAAAIELTRHVQICPHHDPFVLLSNLPSALSELGCQEPPPHEDCSSHGPFIQLDRIFPAEVDTCGANESLSVLKSSMQPINALPIRFHAGSIIFVKDLNGKTVCLSIQRSLDGSWGLSWEFAGGKDEDSDKTLLHTAQRETKEETGYLPLSYADRCMVDCFLHKSKSTGEKFLLFSSTFIVVDDHALSPRRRWSHGARLTGPPSLKRSVEHIDESWVTEAELSAAENHHLCQDPEANFNMLENKKATFQMGMRIWEMHMEEEPGNAFHYIPSLNEFSPSM